METSKRETFEGWCILELMGHRRLAGELREVLVAGAPFVRIDIPGETGTVTQLYAPGAVYCITPSSEEAARAVAKRIVLNVPVHSIEVQRLPAQGYRDPDHASDDDPEAVGRDDEVY